NYFLDGLACRSSRSPLGELSKNMSMTPTRVRLALRGHSICTDRCPILELNRYNFLRRKCPRMTQSRHHLMDMLCGQTNLGETAARRSCLFASISTKHAPNLGADGASAAHLLALRSSQQHRTTPSIALCSPQARSTRRSGTASGARYG